MKGVCDLWEGCVMCMGNMDRTTVRIAGLVIYSVYDYHKKWTSVEFQLDVSYYHA